ncbi:MAG TPA: SDR family oxidoreductase [Calditrichia bacterium]|nr:SDR family oxidoreductase [Calditrichia bacterium]
MNLKESVIVVTGGSAGIGLATAKMLAQKGATVIITARNLDRLEAIAKHNGLVAIPCDVTQKAEVDHLYMTIRDAYGRLDAVINNAGYGYFAPLAEIEVEKFNAVFATNVTGAMMMAQGALPLFKKQGYGNIINISSTAGLRGFARGSAYSATKFALKSMTECWREELRKDNIRVMLINPSEVQTDFAVTAGFDPRPYNPTKLQSEDIAHAIVAALEMEDRGFITELTVFATNPKD